MLLVLLNECQRCYVMVYGNQSIIFLFLLEKYGGSGKKAAVLRLDKAPAPYKVQQQDSQAKEKKMCWK